MPTVIKLRTRTASEDCKPCQANRELQLAAAEQKIDRRPPLPEDQPDAARVTWSGPIIFEEQLTGDGRYIQKNALTWDNLPIPFRYVEEDTGEHDGAIVVGRILTITRKPGGVIWATGDFDTEDAIAVKAARKVAKKLQDGVSADLDNVSFTVKVAKELMDAEGTPGEPDDLETDSEGRVTVLDIGADDEVMDIDDARIRAATLVAVPAFADARITIDDSDSESDSDREDGTDQADRGTTPAGDPCSCDDDDPDFAPDCRCPEPEGDTAPDDTAPEDDELVAAGPIRPPAPWFTDPGLNGPTPITITDEGRIFGHLAAFDTCHQSFQQECVRPPRSASEYAYFRTGAVLTDDGREIPVGHITLDTFHAGKQLGAADTIAHYEHTGATVADVAAGEDDHGIWVAGAVRPNLSDDQLRSLRSSPLSGDWRRIGGNLELVAALAVNVPGFPVPRAQGLVASSGAVQTLVASGIVERPYDRGGPLPTGLTQVINRSEESISVEALNYLRKLTAKDHTRLRAASLHRKVKAAKLADRTMINNKLIKTRGGQ